MWPFSNKKQKDPEVIPPYVPIAAMRPPTPAPDPKIAFEFNVSLDSMTHMSVTANGKSLIKLDMTIEGVEMLRKQLDVVVSLAGLCKSLDMGRDE